MSVDVPNAVSQDGRSSGYRAACETQGHGELQGGDASFRNLLRLDGRPRITGVQMAGLRCQLMRAEVGTVFCRPTGGSIIIDKFFRSYLADFIVEIIIKQII